MQQRILTHYALYSLNQDFWNLPAEARQRKLSEFLNTMTQVGEKTWFYQVFPAQTKFDLLVWTNIHAEENDAPNKFFEVYARKATQFRQYIQPVQYFWGITKPSIYSKAKRSPQELDPFEDSRLPYFIVYPFTKTADWYLKSREERQQMMNEHIRVGKSYPEITQLLLYSFGLQDQEFIVAYEAESLAQFSDLVQELRSSEARLFTLSDIPIITGVYRTAEELAEILSGTTPADTII